MRRPGTVRYATHLSAPAVVSVSYRARAGAIRENSFDKAPLPQLPYRKRGIYPVRAGEGQGTVRYVPMSARSVRNLKGKSGDCSMTIFPSFLFPLSVTEALLLLSPSPDGIAGVSRDSKVLAMDRHRSTLPKMIAGNLHQVHAISHHEGFLQSR